MTENLDPHDEMEELLVEKSARLWWQGDRIDRAIAERLTTRADLALSLEDDLVQQVGRRLLSDRRGHLALYAMKPFSPGEEQTSYSGEVDDPDEPAKLVKSLEATAGGCKWLLSHWMAIQERFRKTEWLQSIDKFILTRLIGRHPLDAALDKRVAMIHLASLALHPSDRVPYGDLICDMSKHELPAFEERVRERWGPILNPADQPKARLMLNELITAGVARLTAKLEAHEDHADEDAERRTDRAAFDSTPEGERDAALLAGFHPSAQPKRRNFPEEPEGSRRRTAGTRWKVETTWNRIGSETNRGRPGPRRR